MNRELFIILATLIITSSMKAQPQPTHYPFNYHDFPSTMTAIIQVQINGVEQTSSDYELGAYHGDTIMGAKRMGVYGSAGYHRVYLTVYGDSNYFVTFKLYNHQTGVELTNCVITYQGESNLFTYASDTGIGTNQNPIVLNFVTEQSFTKEITMYSGNKDHYYLITSPIGEVSPENVTNMLANNYDLYNFDQTNDLEWITYKPSEGASDPGFNLVSGKGYLYANSENVTLIFNGTPYSGDGKVTLTKDDNAFWAGWNLVGNPYGQAAYITKPFYKMNPEGTAITVTTSTGAIEAMEGVFVIADNDGEIITFSTNEPGKKTSALTITVAHDRGTSLDQAIVSFDEESALPKFMLNQNNTKIYFSQDGNDYALISVDGISELPVNFKAGKNGNYTLTFNAEEVSFSYLHLIDNLTSDDIDLLQQSSYTFDASTSDYVSRFKLQFVCKDR